MSAPLDLAWPDVDGRLLHRSVESEEAAANLELDAADLGWSGIEGPVRPVPDSAAMPSPWASDRRVKLCSLVDSSGDPSPACTRTVLRRALDDAAAEGCEVVMAAEVELLLRDGPGGDPVYPFIENYGIVAGAPFESVMRPIRGLRFGGVRVSASNPEYGPGQFEINLTHGPAMEAADAVCLLREQAVEIAASKGLVADVAAKPGPELSGNGLHVHQSLWKDGRNRFWHGGLSRPAMGYLGGLLHHMPELAPLGSPSEEAYLRREDLSFCPTVVSWGGDNRTVAVRALSEAEPATRLEQRDAAADASPHLLMAGQIAAGLDGMRQELDPGPPVEGNAYDRRDLPALPTSLGHALELFGASELARQLLGEEGHDAFRRTIEGRVG